MNGIDIELNYENGGAMTVIEIDPTQHIIVKIITNEQCEFPLKSGGQRSGK
jgi:hypothetical protein